MAEGKNGQPVNMACAFVPARPSTVAIPQSRNLKGWDPRFVSYSNFMDAHGAHSQAPYKPYFAIPTQSSPARAVMANANYKINDNMELV